VLEGETEEKVVLQCTTTMERVREFRMPLSGQVHELASEEITTSILNL
jgi:hypothetical protein